jgi:hypothetical protein
MLDLKDEDVLRRKLEEIERKIIKRSNKKLQLLPADSSLDDIIAKLNEIIVILNKI